jgi:hypothetical protein
LDDLWAIVASIPFKNRQLIEMIRLCFNTGSTPKNIKTIGLKILSLVHFLCKNIDEFLLLNLQDLYCHRICKTSIYRLEIRRWAQLVMVQELDPLFDIENELNQWYCSTSPILSFCNWVLHGIMCLVLTVLVICSSN